MPEMHFRMPRFTYSAYGSFTKNKKEHKNQEKGDTRYSYLNEVKKGYFQHDMAYGAYKHLPRRKLLTKYCMIRRLQLLVIQSMIDINVSLHQKCTFFLPKRLNRGTKTRPEIPEDQQMAK